MTQDLRWALRWLRKNQLFTVAVTAILALGIGANTALFSIIDAVPLRPLPYESSAGLVRIEETGTRHRTVDITAKEYLRWRNRNDLFKKNRSASAGRRHSYRHQ